MSFSGFIVLSLLDQRVQINGPFEDQSFADAEAESATAQGRAREAYVLPIVSSFNEASRPWANPDQIGITRNYPAEGQAETPPALNPDSGEQPLPTAEAEAQADTPTETIQGNVEKGQLDGDPETVGEDEKGTADAEGQNQPNTDVATPGAAESTEGAQAQGEASAPVPGEAKPTARSGTKSSQPHIKL